jgi:hypothetical protein
MPTARLRLGELANVWVDEPAAPFQIALAGQFDATPFLRDDGTVDLPRIRAELARRAGRLPALRRRVIWTRLGQGRPYWADDPAFDAERHIICAPLPMGVSFTDWCAKQIMRPLDRDRPLWRAQVVSGVSGTRFGVLIVVHHAVADGLTGVALVASLMDDAPPDDARRPPHMPPAPVGSSAAAVPAGPPPPSWSGRLRRHRRQLADAAADFRARAPVTSLSGPISAERKLATVRLPLAQLHRAGHQLEVTINDLLLAAVTGGLRELLIARGTSSPVWCCALRYRSALARPVNRPGCCWSTSGRRPGSAVPAGRHTLRHQQGEGAAGCRPRRPRRAAPAHPGRPAGGALDATHRRPGHQPVRHRRAGPGHTAGARRRPTAGRRAHRAARPRRASGRRGAVLRRHPAHLHQRRRRDRQPRRADPGHRALRRRAASGGHLRRSAPDRSTVTYVGFDPPRSWAALSISLWLDVRAECQVPSASRLPRRMDLLRDLRGRLRRGLPAIHRRRQAGDCNRSRLTRHLILAGSGSVRPVRHRGGDRRPQWDVPSGDAGRLRSGWPGRRRRRCGRWSPSGRGRPAPRTGRR